VKNEISGPGCGPLQVDVLVNTLLTPTNLERLSDAEVEFIRSAAVKLALPAPVIDAVAEAACGVAPVVEAEYTEAEQTLDGSKG
jgi:hypothetical protein